MTGITLNILGLGKVGRVLYQVWSQLSEVTQITCYNRSQLDNFPIVTDVRALPPADLWILAVSDDAIEKLAEMLAQTTIHFENAIVCHCSGILSAHSLAPLKKRGAWIASCHPILNCADVEQAVTHFQGCYIGLEGDSQAVDWLTPWIRQLGANPLPLPRGSKAMYHLMSVVSGNFVAILLDFAAKCAEKAGIDQKTALTIIQPLIAGTLSQALSRSPAEALSGPFARLDQSTIKLHLEALSQQLVDYVELYRQLGKAALKLNPTTETPKIPIQKILDAADIYLAKPLEPK